MELRNQGADAGLVMATGIQCLCFWILPAGELGNVCVHTNPETHTRLRSWPGLYANNYELTLVTSIPI